MADQLGSAVLTLSVDDRQFNAGLQQAESTVKRVGGSLQSALGTLGLATSAAGIAAFVGNQVAQLDAASAAVRTLGVDSQELGTRLRALSVELNSNISTLDLTKAAYDVASSGFSSAADATQILRASALGAKGGFAEVNDVASALTGVLNAYGLSASEASKIVDGFVQTQADGVITVRQYAAEIGNIASIAAASGVGIEELNAAIATATLRGVPVSQTFTGLRQALASIIKPSEQAKDLAQSLGIEFNVGALQAKGWGGVLADVQQKTGGAADKIAVLLGSVEAQAAVQPLLNDQLVKYNELLGNQAQNSGAAAEAAQINAETISDGLKQIGNGFSNLATTLDSVLSPLFAGFIRDVNNILNKLNQVAALSPDKVLSREREATDAVAGQLFPGQGSGFFGPVSVTYKGKTYKGSAAGIREAIVQDLLKAELAKINDSTASPTTAAAVAADAPSAKPPTANTEESNRLAKEATKELKAQQEAAAQLVAFSIARAEAEEKILKPALQKLSAAQQLQGLDGQALEAAKQRLAIEELVSEQRKAQADYDNAVRSSGGNSQTASVAEASAKLEAAGIALKTALIEGSEIARRNFEDAAKALRQTSESNFKFLTKAAQKQVLDNAKKDIEVGVQAGNINPRFLNARRPEDVLAAANASRSQVEAIQNFQEAQRDYTGAVSKADQTINAVGSQLTDAANKIVALQGSLDGLASKDWTVNVSVSGDSAANVRVD